jgi:hypothetical protein
VKAATDELELFAVKEVKLQVEFVLVHLAIED